MVEVSIDSLGYGAANLGNLRRPLSDEEAWAILDAAWDAGIRYFDTAPHYGLGLSERRLGAFLATRPRDEYIVSTKVGRLLRPSPHFSGELDLDNDFHVPADVHRVWDLTADGVRVSLEESLERLGLDRVDILYVHDPERHDLGQGIREALPAAARLRDEGMVDAVGFGSMVTESLIAATETGLADVHMVAGRYTIADDASAEDLLPACEQNGVGIVAAAIFNGGLTARDNPSTESFFDYEPVSPERLDRVQRIAATCRDFGVSLPTAALHFPLRSASVRSVVVGGSTPEQLLQSVARLHEPVPDDLWAALKSEELVAA
ncbi:D-threo-aldose 1-dehydrogenase [Microbacteriaceae bacterium SG_E_30_P1]|uniref:D-threo-aldose 1-dehydrogenase n=1 Tax=Antiquaquibacter oligotrophicus TaxID=2880260 RepID=A0ABT6KQT7_9MICO|nr:aldo/keto reductase [Antiquaquibacter oligotrophicus]MDH6182347.1 D-threo-aldose 1-dehydrogenase [Antiquaquibacter oligotrophicus]UDF12000.1 aldo/keto reductase [Antiquaquibacter oligotrophicus]